VKIPYLQAAQLCYVILLAIKMPMAEALDRLILEHWEGDLIKGADNRASVGRLVERTIDLVVLAKIGNVATKAVDRV
jgi:IS30 family transposase